MYKDYFKCKNPPCAQCGIEGGGNMGSTRWGHSFSCCSDECGFKFYESYKVKIETESGRKSLRELWESLGSKMNYLQSGEPYPGYDAECQLKSLGRYMAPIWE